MAALTLALKVTSDVAYVTLMTMLRAGLVKAEWAPDGRTIICFSQWGVSSLSVMISLVLIPHCSCALLYGLWYLPLLHIYSSLFIQTEVRQSSVLHRFGNSSHPQVMPFVPMGGISCWQSAINRGRLWAYMTLLTPID